jgi:diguanylate cyclase (GGDEF)-like protein
MNLLTRIKRPVFSEEKELRFQKAYAEINVAPSRLIQGQICIIFLLAGYLDVVLLGELATLMVFLRYTLFAPIILLIFLFTLTPWFVKYMQVVFCVAVGVVSCYVSLFTFLNEDIIAMLYFCGSILAVFISFIYVPMLFNYAFVMSAFIFAFSITGLLYNESLTLEVIQACILLLMASIFVALIACYTNERNARLNFHYREMLKLQNESLQESNVLLKNLATNDGLTGIANRRSFDEHLLKEWQRAERSKNDLAILLLDVDYFKAYNDSYGHQKGDVCLQEIAKTLDAMVGRVGDFVARYGGEEFVMILPNAKMPQAKEFADKVRASIESLKIPHEKSSVSEFVTISIGVASVIPGKDEFSNSEILLREADRALYQAKYDGRNCVVGFSKES